MKSVRESVTAIDGEIKDGNIAMSPYSSKYHSCDYCAYKNVCAFDGDKRRDRKSEGIKSEVWEIMNEKGGGINE